MRRRQLGWTLLFVLVAASKSVASEDAGFQAKEGIANLNTVPRTLVPSQPDSALSSPDLSMWQFELADNCIVNPSKKGAQPSSGSPLPSLDCPIDPTKVGGAEDRPIQTASSQRLLYNEFNLSGLLDATSFANLGGQIVYAFLPEEGDVVAKLASYYNTISSRHIVINGPGKSRSAQIDQYNMTPILQYAVTDDLTLGGEMTWSSSTTTTTTLPHPSSSAEVRKDQWQNPIFLASYRVADQSDAPVSAFVRGYYRPAIFDDTGNTWGLGGTVLRGEDRFVIGGSFDAIYNARFRSGAVFESSWHYWTTLNIAAELSDRWAIGVGAAYSFPHNQVRDFPMFESDAHQGGAASISAGIGYMLVPDKITIALFGGHQFNSKTGIENIDDLHQNPNGFATNSISGYYLVGLSLSVSASFSGR